MTTPITVTAIQLDPTEDADLIAELEQAMFGENDDLFDYEPEEIISRLEAGVDVLYEHRRRGRDIVPFTATGVKQKILGNPDELILWINTDTDTDPDPENDLGISTLCIALEMRMTLFVDHHDLIQAIYRSCYESSETTDPTPQNVLDGIAAAAQAAQQLPAETIRELARSWRAELAQTEERISHPERLSDSELTRLLARRDILLSHSMKLLELLP